MKSFHGILIFLFCLNGIWAAAQVPGCTDPQAINFNPQATQNNGSCYYEQTDAVPVTVNDSLSDIVEETSGLINWNGSLWTHNDSFGDPAIYRFDAQSGEVLQTITLEGAQNVDWEDIAHDETHIYVGDFGNNFGNRTDLKVYKVAKADIPASGNVSVPCEVINFAWGDQTQFVFNEREHDYDCEAMLCYNDSLYLFSKNWVDAQTRLYVLPEQPGNYVVHPRATWNVHGYVTGAAINTNYSNGDSLEISLIGYINYRPFMALLWDFEGDNFFTGNKRRIDFPTFTVHQTEGIEYMDKHDVYISAERTIVPANLHALETGQWTVAALGIEQPMQGQLRSVNVFPNPVQDQFWLEVDGALPQDVQIQILDSGSRLLKEIKVQFPAGKFTYPMAFTPAKGIYFVRLIAGNQVLVRKFIVE